MCSCKIIKTDPHCVICQVWTAVFTSHLCCNRTAPFEIKVPSRPGIIIWIQPPHLLITSIRHHLRCKFAIFRWMPLGCCFRQCKVCGKYFLAKSQRYELCSDKCRKVQALQNKREFDERARENNYDLLYKNECQNWRNKINRVKNTAGFPADRLEKIQVAFSDFKKEALQRKKAVKTGTASPKEFTDWLYQQSDIILKLTTF